MPAPKNPYLTARWILDPTGAAQAVASALVASRDRDEAARQLGVSRRTLFRWMVLHRDEIQRAMAGGQRHVDSTE
jgi:transposase-like protein